MEILGITAEYNPFHKGHRYHLERARELAEADYLIVAMSGDFVQRGEAAISSKWDRSRDAISFGADVVFELPFVFACNRAEFFAAGAIDTLIMAGATSISFGCECDDTEKLLQLAEKIGSMSDDISYITGRTMREGSSHAKAYGLAVKDLLGEAAANLISKPNNILAVEYLKRMNYWENRGIKLKAVPVVRYGSGYRDVNRDISFAGAGEIRNMISDKEETISSFLPEGSSGWSRDRGFYSAMAEERSKAMERLFVMIKAVVLRSRPEQLRTVFGVREGIENRIKSEIIQATDFNNFVSRIVSGRYTASTVKRILIWILMGVEDSDFESFSKDITCFMSIYLRLLAAGKKGREYLRILADSEHAKGRIVTNANRLNEEYASEISRMLDLDILAADIYNSIYGRSVYDYSDRVVRPYIEA